MISKLNLYEALEMLCHASWDQRANSEPWDILNKAFWGLWGELKIDEELGEYLLHVFSRSQK